MILFSPFVHRHDQPTPAALIPFDDGLVEIVRLIAASHPVEAASPLVARPISA